MVHFLPSNEVRVAYAVARITVPVNVAYGKVYSAAVPKWIYGRITSIHAYTKYDNGKLFLMAFPPWFDPRNEIAPDIYKLPFIVSISTGEGKAVITYLWP